MQQSDHKKLPATAAENTRTEEELRESSARLQNILDTCAEWIWEIDLFGRHTYSNHVILEILGYSSDEVVGEDYSIFLHEDDLLEITRTLPRLITEKRGWKGWVLRWRHKDGSYRYLESNAKPIINAAGEMEGFSGIDRDITERKQAEEELRESKEQFRKVVENSPLAMALVSPDGVIEYINLKAIETFGYLPQEVPNMDSWWVKAYPEKTYRDEVIAQWMGLVNEALAHNHEIEKRDYRVTCKNGSVKIIAIFGVWIADKVLVIFEDITECKCQEQILAESEANYRNLFDSSTDGIFILALDGDFIDANRTAHDRLGYTREEFLALNIRTLDDPSFASRVPERFKQIRERGSAVFESCHMRKDGSMMPVEVNSRLLDYKGMQVFFSVIRDITERKRAEEVLQEREKVFYNLFNNTEIAMFRTRLDGSEVLNVNEKFLELVGQTREEVIGKPSALLWVNPLRRDEMVSILKANGRVVDFEFQMLNKKSGVRDCLTSLNLYPEEGILDGSIIDITERKRAEDKIRQSEQFIRNILDTVDEGFIVIDRDYRILTANRAYCEQVGGCDKDIIGSHCYEQSHKKSKPCFEEGEDCASHKAFETGEPHTALHRHQDAIGSILYVETKAYPIKDAAGNVTSVIEVVNNITEKHLLEEERLKTQKLEAIGTLAGGIAHDFNNLLQGIFGFISMAKMTLDQKDKSRSMLEQAEQALHMSVNLTTQLLTFSKGGKPVKKKIALKPVIENSARFGLSGSRVDYQIKLADGLWAVQADEGQISQVIQNIVINADQAMPEGGSIEITARNVTAPDKNHPQLQKGNYVEIAIKDSGIGVAEQYLKKIFDPYFTTKEKGSGLGLATSYSIIKNHGGLIDVTSEPGKGATFFIYLPAVEAGKEIKEILAAASTARKGRILVMDDEDLILNIAGEMIKALGHDVAFAKHGEAAIEKYQSAREAGKPFDIVILDLTIRGGMGGAETSERLRALDPEVKAIVSSGYSDDAIISDYEKYGFKAQLIKPYRLNGLKDTLNALLGK